MGESNALFNTFMYLGLQFSITDLKLGNIIISFPFSSLYIEEMISNEPPESYPSPNMVGTDIHLLVSQPIHLSMSLATDIMMNLTDLDISAT